MRSLIFVIGITVLFMFAVMANPVAADDILYSENFDSGMGSWSGAWGLATAHSHSAPNSMADSPVGNYQPNSTVTVVLNGKTLHLLNPKPLCTRVY